MNYYKKRSQNDIYSCDKHLAETMSRRDLFLVDVYWVTELLPTVTFIKSVSRRSNIWGSCFCNLSHILV